MIEEEVKYKITYNPTVLNIASGLHIIGCIVYTIVNIEVLASGEGWGIVAMAGLVGIGFVALFVDLILQQFIKNKVSLNAVGLVIVIILALAIVLG